MGGGGRDTFIGTNVIAKCHAGIFTDRRGIAVINEIPGDPWNLLEKLRMYNYTQPPWSTAYPALSAIPNDYSNPGYTAAKNPCGTINGNIGWNALFLEEAGWGGSGGFTYYSISNNIDNQNPLFIDEGHLIMALHDSSPAYAISGFIRVPWEKMGTLAKTKASRPILPTGWGAAPVSPKLYWAPAIYAASHKVYFGTNLNPRLEASKGTFNDSSYSPEILQYNTTYYWCVDELDSQGNVLETGDIWNFKTISN
jgi:hypothetical protein